MLLSLEVEKIGVLKSHNFVKKIALFERGEFAIFRNLRLIKPFFWYLYYNIAPRSGRFEGVAEKGYKGEVKAH